MVYGLGPAPMASRSTRAGPFGDCCEGHSGGRDGGREGRRKASKVLGCVLRVWGELFFVAATGVVDSTPGFFLVLGMSPLVGILEAYSPFTSENKTNAAVEWQPQAWGDGTADVTGQI